jgi:aryl-alcohol dehydrogenase-like predicted oxidoreductase
LGTAQFGAGYGITNNVGRIDDAAMATILDAAHAAGIDLFDTAPDYGDAQERLGSLARRGVRRRFISKFGLSAGGEIPNDEALFARTLAALRVPELYGLLFHRVADLRDPRASDAWELLRATREAGVVSRIGASIYDVADLELVARRFPDLDLIQIPANILDRRLLDHPILRVLHDRGVEVHVRSVYLQGLLLAAPEDLPNHFRELLPIIERLRAVAEQQHTSVASVALGFLRNNPIVDALLVGATSADELSSTIAAWQSIPDDSTPFEVPELRDDLLDPRQWPPKQVEK